MNVQRDLLVHCLECDNTYRESEELFIVNNDHWDELIAVCPHCNNSDPYKFWGIRWTVYVEEQDNEHE